MADYFSKYLNAVNGSRRQLPDNTTYGPQGSDGGPFDSFIQSFVSSGLSQISRNMEQDQELEYKKKLIEMQSDVAIKKQDEADKNRLEREKQEFLFKRQYNPNYGEEPWKYNFDSGLAYREGALETKPIPGYTAKSNTKFDDGFWIDETAKTVTPAAEYVRPEKEKALRQPIIREYGDSLVSIDPDTRKMTAIEPPEGLQLKTKTPTTKASGSPPLLSQFKSQAQLDREASLQGVNPSAAEISPNRTNMSLTPSQYGGSPTTFSDMLLPVADTRQTTQEQTEKPLAPNNMSREQFYATEDLNPGDLEAQGLTRAERAVRTLGANPSEALKQANDSLEMGQRELGEKIQNDEKRGERVATAYDYIDKALALREKGGVLRPQDRSGIVGGTADFIAQGASSLKAQFTGPTQYAQNTSDYDSYYSNALASLASEVKTLGDNPTAVEMNNLQQSMAGNPNMSNEALRGIQKRLLYLREKGSDWNTVASQITKEKGSAQAYVSANDYFKQRDALENQGGYFSPQQFLQGRKQEVRSLADSATSPQEKTSAPVLRPSGNSDSSQGKQPSIIRADYNPSAQALIETVAQEDAKNDESISLERLVSSIKSFGGDAELGIAAYKEGPQKIQSILDTQARKGRSTSYTGIAPTLTPETRKFVDKTLKEYKKTTKESPDVAARSLIDMVRDDFDTIRKGANTAASAATLGIPEYLGDRVQALITPKTFSEVREKRAKEAQDFADRKPLIDTGSRFIGGAISPASRVGEGVKGVLGAATRIGGNVVANTTEKILTAPQDENLGRTVPTGAALTTGLGVLAEGLPPALRLGGRLAARSAEVGKKGITKSQQSLIDFFERKGIDRKDLSKAINRTERRGGSIMENTDAPEIINLTKAAQADPNAAKVVQDSLDAAKISRSKKAEEGASRITGIASKDDTLEPIKELRPLGETALSNRKAVSQRQYKDAYKEPTSEKAGGILLKNQSLKGELKAREARATTPELRQALTGREKPTITVPFLETPTPQRIRDLAQRGTEEEQRAASVLLKGTTKDGGLALTQKTLSKIKRQGSNAKKEALSFIEKAKQSYEVDSKTGLSLVAKYGTKEQRQAVGKAYSTETYGSSVQQMKKTSETLWEGGAEDIAVASKVIDKDIRNAQRVLEVDNPKFKFANEQYPKNLEKQAGIKELSKQWDEAIEKEDYDGLVGTFMNKSPEEITKLKRTAAENLSTPDYEKFQKGIDALVARHFFNTARNVREKATGAVENYSGRYLKDKGFLEKMEALLGTRKKAQQFRRELLVLEKSSKKIDDLRVNSQTFSRDAAMKIAEESTGELVKTGARAAQARNMLGAGLETAAGAARYAGLKKKEQFPDFAMTAAKALAGKDSAKEIDKFIKTMNKRAAGNFGRNRQFIKNKRNFYRIVGGL